MSACPIAVELPSNASPGQIIAATATMLRAFGWELGRCQAV